MLAMRRWRHVDATASSVAFGLGGRWRTNRRVCGSAGGAPDLEAAACRGARSSSRIGRRLENMGGVRGSGFHVMRIAPQGLRGGHGGEA